MFAICLIVVAHDLLETFLSQRWMCLISLHASTAFSDGQKFAEILLEAGGNLQEALKLLERVESAQLVKRYTLKVYGIPTTFKPLVTTFTPVLDGGLYGTGS